ncbi:MAG: XRE family transcriptional regulator [Flavobacterium sp.]|nr:MAG: XRE family transcriptional regulator [Flavobacterium sp.]
MQVHEFIEIQIEEKGKYRLVPQDLLQKLLATYTAVDHHKLSPPGVITVGYLLKLHRNRLNLSQESLAIKANIEKKVVTLIETGKTKKPRKKTLEVLSLILGKEFEEALKFRQYLK